MQELTCLFAVHATIQAEQDGFDSFNLDDRSITTPNVLFKSIKNTATCLKHSGYSSSVSQNGKFYKGMAKLSLDETPQSRDTPQSRSRVHRQEHSATPKIALSLAERLQQRLFDGKQKAILATLARTSSNSDH